MIDVTAIEKRSSVAFLDAIFSAYAKRELVFPTAELSSEVPDGINVTRRIPCMEGGGWFSRHVQPQLGANPAQVILTSGTTGKPKPMLLSHDAQADVVSRLIDVMEMTDQVSEYVAVPVTYSFGFGRVRAIAALGGRCFLPDHGFRADEFAAMLQSREVNSFSAVPTQLRLLIAQKALFKEAGKALRWLEIGSQAMSLEEKRAIRDIFPNARIVQHYGLTEASRTTFLVISSASDAELESVGWSNGSVKVRITDEGLIAVHGNHLASGIVTQSGVESLTDADGWLVTRDMGRIDNDVLVFQGRADDLMNVGGVKVAADAFESALAQEVPDYPFAIAGGQDELRGEIVVVAYPGELPLEKQRILGEAATRVAKAYRIPGAFTLLAVEKIPVTETGKVQRGQITRQYGESVEAKRIESVRSMDGQDVQTLFISVFGPPAINCDQTFNTLGGDSLHYVSILTGLESILPDIPDDWDEMSIKDLSLLARQQQDEGVSTQARWRLPRNLDTVRGLACFLIVALHVVGFDASTGLRLPDDSVWRQAMSSLNLVRLPLFTAMAGFLYAAMPATRRGFSDFLKRKISQMLVPALFAITIYWILRNASGISSDNLLGHYVTGYLHLWFIYALFMIFTVAAFLDVYLGAKVKIWCGVMVLFVLINTLIPQIDILQVKHATELLPYFALGVLLYRIPSLLNSIPLRVFSSAISLTFLLIYEIAPRQLTGLDTMNLWPWLCGFGVIVAVLGVFPRIPILDALALYSFTIYFWHPAANAAVRTILMKLGISSVPLLFAVGLAAGIFLPVMLHIVMMRAPPLARKIVIGR